MSILRARQNFEGNDPEFVYDDQRSFWWTRTGQIVRWSIFFGIFFLFLAYMIIGYWHAKRRINKGLAPLAYHRWLLNRQQRARFDPAYQNPQVFYRPHQGTQYGMHAMPPPMYDPNAPMPPTYQPPEGATKVDPSQWRSQPTRRPQESGEASPAYEAPAGPPPASALHADHTGASTTSNNPYRL
ncbi:uncharacterized protein LY89DRAFT_679459 [Mollisia scopiformis]|uniref:Uncharacterized protein n=1 Tax=Mollisia scopiformis TaxID=149040 RepID=A0A194XVD9_MOLSC|nr:uncharacterized protein LY89DRAFT_679459 [Mollisia scopiformis]KUJ24295.1 hypothetical protein LY89DRAFT_679459 [Mollisia scopiformis]